MNTSKISSYKETAIAVRHVSKLYVAAVLVGLFCLSWATVVQAQSSDDDTPGAQVLTRGPVHEAFAGMVTFNPEPGVVITKAPPNVIEEVPPDERPKGDNVAWIPGYWGWDDERSDFLWVSGTWRALPPGREWMAGYWGQTPQGHQWISGYWADASVRETTYLPPPPMTVEVGPNIAAPSSDYGWTPGCWIWYSGRYAWSPGYWMAGRSDWDWMPAHYVWTPRGYIFVGGYWDYSVERRGILFAPVYFESGVYARRGYYYSPRIVINLAVFHDHLFLRPRYHHYYFGDYYAPSYYEGGFYASFSFQSSRRGYDPFYSHQRWEHRSDRDWEHRVESSYHHRRDHETARPPRTWAAQRNISPDTVDVRDNRVLVASPIDQVTKGKDGNMRFQPVDRDERQKLVVRGQEVQKSREQRRTLETISADATPQKPGEAIRPANVQLPRSPIVGKSAKQLGRNAAPPESQPTPKPDLKHQPQSEPTGRSQNVERNKPQPEPRRSGAERKSGPGREEVTPRERPVQQESPSRAKKSEKLEPEESPKNDRKLEQPSKPEQEQRSKGPQGNASEESQRNPSGLEKKTSPESEPRAQDRAVKPREETQRNTGETKQKAARGSDHAPKLRPDPQEKGAARLLKSDREKEDKEKESKKKK